MSRRFVGGATLTITAAILVAVLLPALEWPPDRVRIVDGRTVTEVTGRVTDVRSEAVAISPTVLGVNNRRLRVDRDTRVFVADKEGGLGDLRVGGTVAAIYESRGGGLVARWLGVDLDVQTLHVIAVRSGWASPIANTPTTGPAKSPVAPPAGSAAAASVSALTSEPHTARQSRASDDPGAVIDWLLRESRRD